MTKKEQAFELFSQGKQPNDPEVQALGIKAKTRREYWRLFRKGEAASPKASAGGTLTGAAKPARDLVDATTVAITPKAFTMSPTLIWQAREAAIREWGWDPTLTPEDFLDTYLFISFKQRGILLGAYQVMTKDKG